MNTQINTPYTGGAIAPVTPAVTLGTSYGGATVGFTSDPSPYQTALTTYISPLTPLANAVISLGVSLGNAIASLPTITATTGTPLKARAGPNSVPANIYDNRPIIQVIDSTGKPIITFDDFILSDIQEQEAEKIDVIETFGTPHLFASGRFMRRYTLQGHLRTTAVNYKSNTPAYVIPMNILFRSFYNNYLRASVQASNQWYTILVADGESYEGYITTFNSTRSASHDSTLPFVMTMCAFNRTSPVDVRALAVVKSNQVFGTVSPATPGTPMPANPLVAVPSTNAPVGITVSQFALIMEQQAELATASQTSNLSLSSGSVYTGAATQVVNMAANGITGNLSVSSSLPGVALQYLNGLSVNGNSAPQGALGQITAVVTDAAALASASGLLSGSQITVPMNITSSQGISAALNVVTQIPQVQQALQGVSLISSGLKMASSLSGGTMSFGKISDIADMFSSLARVRPPLTLNLSFYTNNTVSLAVQSIYPALGTNLQSILNSTDVALANNLSITQSESIPSSGKVTISLQVDTSSLVFEEADTVVLLLKPTIQNETAPLILIPIQVTTASQPNIFQTLSFTGSNWNPVSVNKLNQLGTLNFNLSTLGNQRPTPSSLDALRAAYLTYGTKFSQDSLLSIGAIPLSGTAYGYGTVNGIAIKTISSLTWNGTSIKIIVTLYAVPSPDSTYDINFWNELTKVSTASIQMQPNSAISAPGGF
jgi:hypothetical protein